MSLEPGAALRETMELSGDLARRYVVLACALAAIAVVALVVELALTKRTRKASAIVASTGVLASLALLGAVLRPAIVRAKGSLVGPKVVALVDASRSMDLPGLDGTRRQTAARALAALEKNGDVRLTKLAFGDGAPKPLDGKGADRPLSKSDLTAALEAVAKSTDERPSAIVVFSDGRFDRPGATNAGASAALSLGPSDAASPIPVHTVAVAKDAPPDASIRAVRAAGAAVAHQPFSLRIEVGCEKLTCGDIPVVARELREEGAPTQLASGTAHIENGQATIELEITIERAGARILEVAITPPAGDTIPENDRRFVTLNVTRDRIRLLHVAGHPTYDVRALRMWLKSDASVDVVAFFILRTKEDDVHARSEDLALIPFPVDELFEEHLPSFDAVVLQDFNAEPYQLTHHLPSLARYVKKGGGLIMVGGPDSFVAGNYARTPLAEVLPIDLDIERRAAPADVSFFTPRVTEAGKVAPVLGPLRALIGDDWPEMPGTNIVGDAKPGATVLLEHPTRRTASGAPMPVLALGEIGSGRTMALTIDGSHRLLFSSFAESAAGRAHGAFWDAMLGWLMRDPRFEPAVVEPKGGCIAGVPTTLSLRPLPGPKGKATITVSELGSGKAVSTAVAVIDGTGAEIELPVGALAAGGYSAQVLFGTSSEEGRAASGAIPTRRDFACEKGGDEWADSRPDVDRLRAIASATNGQLVFGEDAAKLRLPPATQIASERHVAALVPPWVWTLLAALALGAHWVARRRAGLA